MFEDSGAIELRFFSNLAICFVIISFFSNSWNIFHLTEISYISLAYKKYPFIMELILKKNINKTKKQTNKNVNDDGNN